MKGDISIYNYDGMYEATMKRVIDSKISDQNKQLIQKFSNFCFANGIGKPRVIKYARTLRQLAEWLEKDFPEATKQDIERVVTTIQMQDKYSEWTKKDFNIALRKFYKWLHGDKEYPEIVRWLKTRPNKSKIRLPSREGLLTQEEIEKLIESTDHPRNKALIALLYESGCRIGEIASLKINNVAFDEKGAVLTVLGKTGSRRIRVVSSVSYLLTWINNHPNKETPSSPLWVNIGAINNRLHMRYGTIRSVFKRIFKKAGIKKRFNPHLFRHSRSTFLSDYLTEPQLCVYLGWVQGSEMPRTYIHLSGRDTDHKILAMNGLEEENKKKEVQLKPKVCPRCKAINAHTSNYCSSCASILDTQTAVREQIKLNAEQKTKTITDEVMSLLISDSQVKDLLLQKIHDLNLGSKLKELGQ